MSNFKHHDDDTCPHLVVLGRLEAENARLKTEVEHLMVFCNCTLIPNKELQARVERLTKAGYAMAIKINVHGINDRFTDSQKLVDDWSNAAKEGKPGA